ncbi:hypothetical protein F5876DRAFT_65768 [Lentinula aff. lateritia]|uniref:Uncharacterized protein n=1 Tax=Lentinula aff. lateritia TaxID=2804960 RepID=A0ACC1U0P7_9AGAR|nr:hypothetical protein F5876DRAFT_65768 [Lentinula aff. lateritia]
MFQTALHSIFTVVLPRPFFKVTPSKPDPIYYTATAFVSFDFTLSAVNECNSVQISSLKWEPELQLLTAVASSLLKSPSPRSFTTKVEKRHSTDPRDSSSPCKTYKHTHMPSTSQDFQEHTTPDGRRLRRTSKRILSSHSENLYQITTLDSFDSPFKYKSKSQPLEFLQTAKRCSAIFDAESPLSSCSSFDASDNEGTYPSTSAPFPLSSPVFLSSRAQNRTQAYSDVNFPPAFELSPIIEDPNTFEDMDDILAYYSDSPVLGRLNESHTHSEIAFNEGDWEPEVILGFETKLKTDPSDISVCARRMSFVLKSTDCEDNLSLPSIEANTVRRQYKDLLFPPSLTLTFPTPEMQDVSTFPESIPLMAESNQLLPPSPMPQTPPSSTRRSLGRNLSSPLVPPTPMPSLPRCTSCGFGFSFDITSSNDLLHRPIDPCEKCQAQWDRCQKWYGKRGWEVGANENTVEATSSIVDMKKEKVLKRASRRLSRIVEGVFIPDRRSRQSCVKIPSQSTTWSSKRISFMDRSTQENTGSLPEDADPSSQDQTNPPSFSALEELETRAQDYSVETHFKRRINLSPDVVTRKTSVLAKLMALRAFSRSKTEKLKEEKGEPQPKWRRSFLNLDIEKSERRPASYN